MISIKSHGFLDYLTGLFLIASPWIFDFSSETTASQFTVGLGTITILYSLCTKYSQGFFPLIDVRAHLALDFLSGLFLSFSPLWFDFSSEVKLLHFGAGLAQIILVMLTQEPQARSRNMQHMMHRSQESKNGNVKNFY